MARKTHPRKNEAHRLVAAEVLHRHATNTGEPITLPVPIEMIVELTYELSVDWDDIPEPPDHNILGALAPTARTIVMNTRHLPMFDRWIGPERFTLAHELAHWIYDAESPDQGTLDLGDGEEVFCRRDDTSTLDDTTKIREQNANALAAHILLPDDLVLAHDLDEVLADFRGTAHAWGVSQQTLRIKLERLDVLDDADLDRLDLGLD
ncbi:MAG: ImmA/IrrE family metallo-endopeptidase [Acidimicrobiales bacterium]|nr:ImmA/IrrE family metallo-endopeptidase [Acidimicrobiales bacterium]